MSASSEVDLTKALQPDAGKRTLRDCPEVTAPLVSKKSCSLSYVAERVIADDQGRKAVAPTASSSSAASSTAPRKRKHPGDAITHLQTEYHHPS